MPPKADWDKYIAPDEEEIAKEDEKIVPLSEGDIQVLRTYVCAQRQQRGILPPKAQSM